MAGFIRFSDSQVWSTSNWVYWGLMDHLINACSNDQATANVIEQCKWAQSMSFPILCEESLATLGQIREKLETIAVRGAHGELKCAVDGQELEHSSQLIFREEVNRLANMLLEQQ